MYDTQYDYEEVLYKRAFKVNFHVLSEIGKSICY